MQSDWIFAAISGASGVAGALIGAGATLAAARRLARDQAASDHDRALVAFRAAVGSWMHLWGSLAEIGPPPESWIGNARRGLQIGGYGKLLINRQFAVTDSLWRAMGEARSVASRAELAVIAAVEDEIVKWTFGQPMPETFPPVVSRLRLLIESLGEASTESR